MRKPLTIVAAAAVVLAVTAGSIGVAGAHRARSHLARPVHIEATFAHLDGSTRFFVGDRGEITGVDATSLTILRPDDVSVTVTLSDRTCIHVDGKPAAWEDVTVGEPAAVLSAPDSVGGLFALVVRSGHPWFKPDRDRCGLFEGAYHADGTAAFKDGSTKDYAWDRGRISGIAPRRIRIERLDGASVTAEVDRHTLVFGVRSYRNLNLGEPVWMISEKVGGDPDDLLAKIIRRIRRP